MDGIKSINVCTTDIATINVTNIIGFIPKKTDAERDKRTEPIRFMWIPGERPVNVPAKMPRRSANKSSINMLD